MKQKLLKIEQFIISVPEKIKATYHALIKHIQMAIEKAQDLSATNYELGIFHLNKGNIRDAIMRFLIVIKLKKEYALANYQLARCYIINSKLDKAKEELNKAISLDPKLSKAKYRMDFLNKALVNKFIPVEITKEDSDAIAYKYEDLMLEQLEYKAPELLSQAIAKTLAKENLLDKELNCLDLGCGTGLLGAALKSEVTLKSLVGIDISPKMLELAKTLEMNEKPVYNETIECDFHNLEPIKDKFNVITSSISFGNANDLNEIFKQLDKMTYNNSVFGLVVLKSNSEDIKMNYEYSCFEFSENFLNNLFKKHKWSVEIKDEIKIFKDKTAGYLFILLKK